MRSLISIGFLFLLLTSCQGEEKVVHILFDDSEGLSDGQQVLLNGVSVGTLLDVDIAEDYQVITSVELSGSHDFPKDSQFEIQSQDLFTKMIFVTLGESETLIKNGDTIQGVRRINTESQVSGGDGSPKLLDDVKEMLKN
jgi:ABC-type transporter Mla subunit MlaD